VVAVQNACCCPEAVYTGSEIETLIEDETEIDPDAGKGVPGVQVTAYVSDAAPLLPSIKPTEGVGCPPTTDTVCDGGDRVRLPRAGAVPPPMHCPSTQTSPALQSESETQIG
jgi:hypothetical protein